MPRRWIAAVAALLVCVLAWPREASAIPAFARRYATSCQTCHVPFPKLNPFGEAFRKNGYRFPAGEDEDAVKEAVIPLGQEAHKKVFPEEVWPASLPASIPLSATLAGRVELDPDPPTEADPEASFAALAGSLGLKLAATFDDTFSVWAAGELTGTSSGEATVSLERAFLVVKFFDDPVLNLRIGRFEPGVMGISMHRLLGAAPWVLTTPIVDDSFALEPVQLGFEATGVTGAGRMTYAVGFVEGGGDRIDADKDVYGRLAAKIGGMRLDGLGGASDAIPWRETSLELGGFGYFGRAAIGDPDLASQEDTHFRVGGDLHGRWRDLSLYGAGSYGRNSRPSLAEPYREIHSWHVMGQADYVVRPFLVPTVRYERRVIDDEPSERLSGGIYVLLRANIRTQVLASAERVGGDAFAFGKIVAGLNTAF